jgi:hypothetical protein
LSASEFAFLAVGLVLGVASGAALIEVLRARPPASREVRVTVAPNAIQSRMSATLAEPSAGRDLAGPAAGGPGDRRWRDELFATGEPATTGRRSQDVRAATIDGPTQDGAPIGTPVRPRPASAQSQAASVTRPDPLWLSPTAGPAALVAVPMSLEPDPITTALRASAAASAVAAMRQANGGTITADRPAASTTEPAAATRGPAATAGTAGEAGPSATAGPADASDGSEASPDPGAGAPGSETTSAATSDGPCAEERRVADERCTVATLAREGAGSAHGTFRQAQRTYDELVARAEEAALTADPRAVRSAKEAAQRSFHEARGLARTRDDVEAGARTWLSEINRINQETREAALAAERDRAAAAALAADLERLAVEADAARISAERAEEACLAAREAVAACDEARVLAAATAAARSEPAESDAVPGRIPTATVDPEDEFDFVTPMGSRAALDAPILRILRGDREAMQRAVARLAGDDPDAHRLWQTRLSDLAEALIARSIEATAFVFPMDHPFWGPFNQGQGRDIAAALSSLGFRFDGFGGWVDERLPTQRDLAMAVGYAGLDPMRVRHWPNEAQTRDLLRDVRVAADEYIAGAAGGLTLGELLTLLGRRADALTGLWNEWGTVRPILLEAG